ncbi:MAG: hypothetical protein ABFR89_12565 [Actinomycetota bacterium]
MRVAFVGVGLVLMLIRGWSAWLGAVALVAVACGGGSESPTAALDEHVVGGDALLVMQPGEGHGETADHLVALFAGPMGGAREGTANHIAWFDRDIGPVHVITFTAGRENPRGGEPEFCVWFHNGISCGLDPDEPILHGWGDDMFDGGPGFGADAYGGADGAEAVFTTESGNTVSVLTVGGYAHAEWPREWGEPQTVEFYDTDGNPVTRLEFLLDD